MMVQLKQPASWHHPVQHTLKLYKLDKPNLFYQLNPAAQNAMNMSFAAQVMSHTVAASIFAEVTRGEEHSTVFSQL
jgi:hypothetical protein